MRTVLGLLVVSFAILASARAEAACSGSGKSWSCPAGSSVADVNAALGSASDGATLEFAAGDYAWSSSITLSNDKGVTLRCATAAACNVTVGSTSSVIYMDSVSGTNEKLYRVSGFRFRDAPAGSMPIWIYGTGKLVNLRIDHNTFQDFGADTIAVMLGAHGPFSTIQGLLDHNTVTGKDNFMFVKVLGPGDPNAWPPSPKGTANAVFAEDNDIAFDNVQNLGLGCMDIWDSAAMVWRHNQTKNCLVTSHGVAHGGGAVSFELYANTLTRSAGSGDAQEGYRLFHHQGSGEFIAFDNTFAAVAPLTSDALAMTHYRSADPGVAGYDTALGRCDGTSSIDGNWTPASTYFGYPCWRQPGRDGAGKLQPMYVWNNRWTGGGAKIDMLVENPWAAKSPGVEDHLVAERDYYNAVSASAQTSPTSPFDGKKGVGFGTLANRPKSCTTNPLESGGGVGYFATDDGPMGTLYRCSAADTWSVQYQPFTYPHPLQTSCTLDTDCPPPGACQSAKCDASAGLCSVAPLPDGAACPGGTCQAGGCQVATDGGVGGSSGGGGSAGSGGSATGGSAGAKAKSGDSDGGCGCKIAGASRAGAHALWLCALLALLRRRRAQPPQP